VFLLLLSLLFIAALAMSGSVEVPITPEEIMAAKPLVITESATIAIARSTKLGYMTVVIVSGPQAKNLAKRYGGTLLVLEAAHLMVYFDVSVPI
jgi:hypothetical protein